jgi:hypothetical protein
MWSESSLLQFPTVGTPGSSTRARTNARTIRQHDITPTPAACSLMPPFLRSKMVFPCLYIGSLNLLTTHSRQICRKNSIYRSFATADGSKKKAPGTSQLKAPLLFGIGLMTGLLIFDSDFEAGADMIDDSKGTSK